MNNKQKKGFTLIEILLVIAAISILASIVIVAINPAKQLGETRNAQRRSDVKTILDAVWQYAIDNDGDLPSAITTTNTPICTGIPASVSACTAATPDYIDLTSATTALDIAAQKYIVALPTDPQCATAPCASGSIGYSIFKSANGRVTVSSLHQERITTATVTLTSDTAGVLSISSQTAGSGYTALPSMPAVVYTCSITQPTTLGKLTATLSAGAITFVVGTPAGSGGSGCAATAPTLTFPSPIFVSR